ncbi:zinc finger and SCAN domain-containing protein 4 [Gorilla gorilla gorilla]|uniref:zinc finger and SCAN domain-containing protein 4 n=1 Tax=Gorilla gorilla gorilla TaxID=9595 RepID=UPI002445EE14|nr:zinc finger and SCAN domain-containing protein 4 [Gorilla gorilla gorilla]
MALDLRTIFQCEPSENNLGSENSAFQQSQGPAVQREEGISEFSRMVLNSFQDSNNSYARQELQRLYRIFHSWLQPEKHSKDEIISLLVLEQFMIGGHCNDKASVKEKWKSSGKNLERFIEDLTDDSINPPALVHVHMQGQEALFSEDMPLRDVIVHLTKQVNAQTTREANMGTPSQTSQDTSLETGQGYEDEQDGWNSSLKTTQVNENITNQGNQIVSLIIIQEENGPRPEEGGVSSDNPYNSKRAELVTARSQEGSINGITFQGVPMVMGAGCISQPEQSSPESALTHQSNEGNSTCEVHQKGSHGVRKSYKCEECPKVFKYHCHLLAHQRRHRNERPFVCPECQKGFFQISDLRVHQIIHTGKKPFTCSMCKKSFSHKTNLRSHERIHTGEKPYTCPFCKTSYRQSSTYHRHMRTHEKITLPSVPSTPEAS